jgi:hypothetical protein
MSDAIKHECGIALLRLKKPLEYYKYILNLLETDFHSPWVIERLESYIFLQNDFKINY